ncbi:hypothetical protein [Vreelandella populi]|uniref:Uncharacterized protein n=1 Tax=Vreelandella populi TaxID=2498858 RepID=A0A433LG51_9GAMM|nr:hypothetical protein [Halomonas populi]RUR48807.1 hypothetical protein ELY37_02855 [Halomonas populi]
MNNDINQDDPLRLCVAGFAAPDAAYMLESAINATAAAANDAEDRTALILDDHLKSLCEMQRNHIHDLLQNDYYRATHDMAPESVE